MYPKTLYLSSILLLIFLNTFAYGKQPPPGSGITDVKSNILIVLATTNTMSGNMAIPVIDFRSVNDSEPDSLEGNIHSLNWSGGHVTLHTYLGAALLDYGRDSGWSGYGAKIAHDACNNMYGKNGGRILLFSTNPCSGSSFTWNRQDRVNMSATDGAINCGSNNDDSGLAIYERKGEIYITDRSTHNTCIFNLNRIFLRSFNTSARDNAAGLGGSTQHSKVNHSIAIDQVRGLLYYWQSDERKLYVDFIDHEITDPADNPTWRVVSEQLSTSNVCPGRGGSIDCVTDIAVDGRGDVYLADRDNGRIVKFSGYSQHSGHAKDGMQYIDNKICTWSGQKWWNAVYAFGIDDTIEPNVAWGASYGRNKVAGINLDDHRDGSHDWSCGAILTDEITPRSRMVVSADVLKRIMRDNSLTEGANFGLMTFDNTTKLHVEIKKTGYQEIIDLLMSQTIDSDGCLTPDFRCGDPNITNVADHKSLAGLALEDSKKYFNGELDNPLGGKFTSPVDENASCQNHYVILMTDDIADDDPLSTASTQAALMRASVDNILTYVVGVGDSVSDANITLFLQEVATAGGTDAPFFAENERTLVAQLKNAIRVVITRALTFTAPTIMPETTSEGDEQSYIYQSVFEFKDGKEWQGNLKKYLLDSNGIPGALPVWNAGELLPLPSARKIWVPFPNLPPDGNLNNFNTQMTHGLFMNEMYSSAGSDNPPDNTGEGDDNYETIQFIMGYNSWDTDLLDPTDDTADDTTYHNRERAHYLPDIYHSRPILVAAPAGSYDSENTFTESYYRKENGYETFYENKKSRKKLVIAGGNSGLLHAFNLETGVEEWAFMPPSFISKMLDMKPIAYNPSDDTSKQTQAIFGVDGSPIVKDIKVNNEWKTILLCGLGKGGASYFALDITDPSAPKHLFTFENDLAQKRIYYWDAAGNKTSYRHDASAPETFQDNTIPPQNPIVPSEYDFRLLGAATSTPMIQLIKIGNVQKWVGIFGGGLNTADSDIGSVVYIIDLEDGGKIINKIIIDDMIDSGEGTVAESPAGSVNTVRNSVHTRLIPVTPDQTSLAQYYGALLYFVDYEGKLWKINLSSEGTLYDKQILFDTKATATNGRANFFEPSASIDEVTNKLWLYYGTGDMTNLSERTNESAGIAIQNKIYGIKDNSFPATNAAAVTPIEADCTNITGLTSCVVESSSSGWFANLDANEKITGTPAIKNGVVYFPRYVPDEINPCTAGTAYLSSHDYRVGCAQGSVIPEGETTVKKELGKGVATGAVFYKGKLYMGLSGAASDDTTLDSGEENAGWSFVDNIIVGTQTAGTSSSTGTPIINWWKQIF